MLSTAMVVLWLLSFHVVLGSGIPGAGCRQWCKGGATPKKDDESVINHNKTNQNRRRKKRKSKKLKNKSFSYMIKCFVVSIFDPTVNGEIEIQHNNTAVMDIGNGGGVMFANTAAAPSYGPVCGPNGCF